MPKEKSIEFYLDQTDPDLLDFTPSNLSTRHLDAQAYIVLYQNASRKVANPKDLVKILKRVPWVWKAAKAVVVARENHDKKQSKAMLFLIHKAVSETLDYAKKRKFSE